jgi:DNA invertase Pin-like site-specific DNA recombinase
MSYKGQAQLDLAGDGAAYIRVSDDEQDVLRQYAALHAFEKEHGVTIPAQLWFEDQGWTRDQADVRPAFQKMIKLAEEGRIRWIVVDRLNRFGTKNSKQLMAYLYRLEEAGCRLYDATGKEWTGEDIATIITAVVEGEKSKGDQIELSNRVLGGKAEKARRGEWQGGQVAFGMDVVCFSRQTGEELWRVLFEGKQRRLKVFAGGRSERFDGKGNFPVFQDETEVLRLAPSKDQAKLDAAIGVFKRFATEEVSTTALAHWLDSLGFKNSNGGTFQGGHIEIMLRDPIYLGYYAYNRRAKGKFHRFKGGRTVPEMNYRKKITWNDEADLVKSHRLFDELVDRPTWVAVQKKLDQPKRKNALRSPAAYLAGLAHCGNCGVRMRADSTRVKGGRKQVFFFCGSYHEAARAGKLAECKCLRNSISQQDVEPFIDRYLTEAGHRLDIMTDGMDADHLTERLEQQESGHWQEFALGLERLQAYLSRHHPAEYSAILDDSHSEDATPHEFVTACLDAYKKHFDPSTVKAELDQLEAKLSKLMDQWADLPTPRAREKAKESFTELEARIDRLKQQQEDASAVVEQHYYDMLDLQEAIRKAREAMHGGMSESALRQRAGQLRGVIERIELTFTATGKRKSGPGNQSARLVKVTFYPIVGESREYRADEMGYNDRPLNRASTNSTSARSTAGVR